MWCWWERFGDSLKVLAGGLYAHGFGEAVVLPGAGVLWTPNVFESDLDAGLFAPGGINLRF